MAVHHHATITPTKAELLAAWVPTLPWYDGPDGVAPDLAGAYRFDDPAGQVGMETHLVRVGDGPWLQVPLTYRDAPLDGAEEFLVGTMEHSTLGRRWVYDGCGDPVYAAGLATTVLGGGRHADLFRLEDDGSLTPQEPRARVRGSGTGTGLPEAVAVHTVRLDGPVRVIEADGVTLRVPHVLDAALPTGGVETLTGTWAGQDEPLLLATVEQPDIPGGSRAVTRGWSVPD